MPDFIERRQLARILNRNMGSFQNVSAPQKGWIWTMRTALGMSAEQVASRKGVSRNAVYQAERSEQEGAVSLKQMENLAKAMGGRFVYAIVPDEPVEALKHKQAVQVARSLSEDETDFHTLGIDEKQDWIDDKSAELLHNMPSTFWDLKTG
ncbi:MAG: helix-turn-helix domain-containing protein [Litoreibacter sp.]